MSRSAASRSRAEIAATFDQRPYPGGLTYSGHPLACASAVATINAMAEERHRGERRRDRRDASSARRCARSPSATRPSARSAAWASSGRSTWSRNKETREPLVPYNAAGAANAPMAEFAAACKRGGLWPFVNMNRTHVVPACTVTEAEAKEGLAVLDEALTAADAHTV